VSDRLPDLSGNGAQKPFPSGVGVLDGWRRLEFEHTPIFVQPAGPDWFVPNARADTILREIQAGATALETAARYREQWGGTDAASWEDVQRTLARVPGHPARPQAARAQVLRMEGLRECWLHISNRCNLACSHCMFASSPHDALELPTSRLLAIAAEARDLGCRLFYLTGGEPLVHPSFPTLCCAILQDPEAHVVVLSNALLLARIEADLAPMPRDRVHFQVSLDCPHGHHDAIRGEGCYERVLARTRRLVELGFPVTLAMAVDGRNAHHMPELVEVAASLGVTSVHYLWHFVRGGGLAVPRAPVNALFAGLREAHTLGGASGVAIDNVAIFAAQVFALPGTRHDLSNAGWESLAVGPDDRVYPTAAMVLDDRVACGIPGAPLAEIWRNSPVLAELRRASVANAPAAGDTLAYIVGGGDVDHSYLAGGRFTGRDPYRELADRIALWLIAEQAGTDPMPSRAALLARMGERVESCAESADGLAFTHSNCVLSLPGKDGHTLVRDFYAAAAAAPQTEIVNPVAFDAGETAHVPEEAKTRSYGCGSPVLDAYPLPGESVIDLGCGAGMECAIAAKKVGPTGRVVGIDMLDEMLALASRTAAHAARELGHDVIEVRKGLLESIPCPDASADVVISNCVINLSSNKRRTFHEILRVLKPGGRLVIADVVTDEEPPIAVRSSERLRGECLGGAMLQCELFQLLEDCGFAAVMLLKRFPYRTVAGHRFYSVSYRAERPRTAEPSRVVYRGPFAAVVTDDGCVLRRGEEAVAAVPLAAADQPVFLLDGEGAVANVDLGAGCSCFIPPQATTATPAAPPSEKLTDREGCMVCGEPLEYLPVAVAQRCHFCGRELSASARCAAGHFVCDVCHTEDAAAAIRAICGVSRESDMVALMRHIRQHPALSIHGPEHHVLVPAVVVTAARNAGLPVDERHLDTAIARGKTIAGGACAFMGACGAALGVGTGFSVILGINPYQGENRQTVQQLVGRALARIAALPAARCCQRDCWLALQEAAASSEALLGVQLLANKPLVCAQETLNKECLHADCPLWPRRVDGPSPARNR
jgi:MoaA/NifB/PqqE/SkfB family radical SAM enzyme/SAM-dependent methyltransferase